MTGLSTEVTNWFGKLQEEIWSVKSTLMRANMSGTEWVEKYLVEKRKLTDSEWRIVRMHVEDLDLPVELSNSNFGFGIAMHVRGASSYPGIDPEILVTISGKQLPGFDESRHRNGFDLGWTVFAPLALRIRNADLLSYYNLPPIQSKSHYAY